MQEKRLIKNAKVLAVSTVFFRVVLKFITDVMLSGQKKMWRAQGLVSLVEEQFTVWCNIPI